MWGDGGGEQEQERLCEASGQPPELLDPGGHVAAGLGWMGECGTTGSTRIDWSSSGHTPVDQLRRGVVGLKGGRAQCKVGRVDKKEVGLREMELAAVEDATCHWRHGQMSLPVAGPLPVSQTRLHIWPIPNGGRLVWVQRRVDELQGQGSWSIRDTPSPDPAATRAILS